MNETLKIGTVFPYVEWAKEQGLACLIMNPNLHTDPKTKVKTGSDKIGFNKALSDYGTALRICVD